MDSCCLFNLTLLIVSSADDDTIWFGFIDVLDDDKEGVLSEVQVHAWAAEYDGIGVGMCIICPILSLVYSSLIKLWFVEHFHDVSLQSFDCDVD